MAAIGFFVTFYQKAIASSDRMKEIFAQKTDVPEAERPFRPPSRPSGLVEMRDLTFSFPGTTALALSGISLKIEPGERVAFVGTIGSGKTALLGLLPRLYPVARGMLFVDGVDVNEWSIEELREHVGYVGQDLFLFSETVTENLAFGLRGEELQPHVESAAELAAVHDDVMGFHEAYNTRLGERGINLSGGQKQRISIARALAKKPAILILDDALSSVDVETEEKILKGIRSREGRNTELISAHRISTIRDADRIIVMEQGKIVQQGRHENLIRDRSGLYRRFYEQQRRKEELERYVEKIDAQILRP
jgi:ATP-binding cassette subfamily B protein